MHVEGVVLCEKACSCLLRTFEKPSKRLLWAPSLLTALLRDFCPYSEPYKAPSKNPSKNPSKKHFFQEPSKNPSYDPCRVHPNHHDMSCGKMLKDVFVDEIVRSCLNQWLVHARVWRRKLRVAFSRIFSVILRFWGFWATSKLAPSPGTHQTPAETLSEIYCDRDVHDGLWNCPESPYPLNLGVKIHPLDSQGWRST